MTNNLAGLTCGFIGLGSQGAPMAQRMIDAGLPVTLWARRPETLTPFQGGAAQFADSVAELGARSSHVGVCVIDDAGVEQVCEALIPAMQPGGLIAVHSTILPDTCRVLAERAATRGLQLIDAPVSGGEPAAKAGTLTVMVGGDNDAVALARPVFETFGQLIVHLGAVGAGQNAKIVNNALMAANMGAAHHALSAAAALGVDRAALAELIKVSSGRSYAFEICARLPAPTAFRHGATMLAKDVKLLCEVLREDPAAAGLDTAARPLLDLALRG